MSVSILIALALAPAIFLMIVIYGKDKYDREPKMVLLKAFMLGAISVIPAGLIEYWVEPMLGGIAGGITGVAITAFIGVGLVEELCKYFMIRIHAYRHPAFNEPFDGIVYASFVGLGFAAAENVMYVLQGGLSVAVIRMFTAVPAHYAFAVVMGYYVGKAKFDAANSTLHLIRGVFYATFLHGAYDFFVMQQDYPALGILTIGVLIMALRMSRRSIEELHADSMFRFHERGGA